MAAAKTFCHAVALIAGGLVLSASPASAMTFRSAVEQVLMSQTDGPLATLDAGRKRQMVSCVNGVLAGLPKGRQRFVVEASSVDEIEDRFGKVVMENRAEWKQKIAAGCAHIVVSSS
jgi:hypothetical protein